jgi:adenosylcobinamide-GDP ribazoletransferase
VREWCGAHRHGPRTVLREIRSATGLLTRFPVAKAGGTARTGSAAFALVGAGLGLLAATPIVAFGHAHQPLAAVVAIGLLTLVTGALHLDGLADTADALAASDPTTAERARRDPAVGAAGAAAVVLVLMLDAAALAAVRSPNAASAVVVAGAVSRAIPALAAPWVPRPDHGFGAWFAAASGRGGAAAVVLTSLALALLLPGTSPKFGVLAGLIGGLVVLVVLVRRFGVASGDTFGAAIEVAFAASLFAQAVAS